MSSVSRAERRTRAQAASQAPVLGLPLDEWRTMKLAGLGLELVPGSHTKWFAFRCWTDGSRDVLTPLYGGMLKGESKPAATGRIRLALLKMLGGVE